MSFSSDVKKELLAIDSREGHCQAAELSAMVSGAGRIHKESGRWHITLTAENEQVVHRYVHLLAQTGGIRAEVTQAYPQAQKNISLTKQGKDEACRTHPQAQKNKISYTADVFEKESVQRLISLLKIGGTEGTAGLLEKTCCKRAFLRGAFLVSGSMSNPKKSYHFEIVCADAARAGLIQQQFGCFGLEAKIVTRKNHEIVYLKEGSQIVDALNIMGAHAALMNLENVRILKEMRNDINRRVNCETANINKTVNAAYRQQEAIRFLHRQGFLQELPRQLKEIAALRMEYPEAAIKELGMHCHPPVGKSGVNHRLRKLEEIAKQKGMQKKE